MTRWLKETEGFVFLVERLKNCKCRMYTYVVVKVSVGELAQESYKRGFHCELQHNCSYSNNQQISNNLMESPSSIEHLLKFVLRPKSGINSWELS